MSKSTNKIDSISQSIKNIEKNTDKILHKLDDSVEEYSEKELHYLDIYQEFTNHAFEDEDLYEVITKYNFDDNKIKKELEKMLRDLKKGDDYQWQTIEKGKKKKEEPHTQQEQHEEVLTFKKNFSKNKGYYKSYGKRKYQQEYITEGDTAQDLVQENQEDYSRIRRGGGGGYRGRRGGYYSGYNYSRGYRGRGGYSHYSDYNTYQETVLADNIEEEAQVNVHEPAIVEEKIKENTEKSSQQIDQKIVTGKDIRKASFENEKEIEIEKCCTEQTTSSDKHESRLPQTKQLISEDPSKMFAEKTEKVKVQPNVFKVLGFSKANFEILSPPKSSYSICKEINTFHCVTPKISVQSSKQSSTNKPLPKKVEQQTVSSEQEYQATYGAQANFSMYQQPPSGGDASHNYSMYQPFVFIPPQSYFHQEASAEPDSSMKSGMKGGLSSQGQNLTGMQSSMPGESLGQHPQYIPYPPYYYYNQNPYAMTYNMSHVNPMETLHGYGVGYEKPRMKGNEESSGSASNYYYGQYKQGQ